MELRPYDCQATSFHSAITQGLELGSPFSHRMCILGPIRILLKMGSIDLDLQSHFGLKLIDFLCKFELIRAITRQGFELGSPFLPRMCIKDLYKPIEHEGD